MGLVVQWNLLVKQDIGSRIAKFAFVQLFMESVCIAYFRDLTNTNGMYVLFTWFLWLTIFSQVMWERRPRFTNNVNVVIFTERLGENSKTKWAQLILCVLQHKLTYFENRYNETPQKSPDVGLGSLASTERTTVKPALRDRSRGEKSGVLRQVVS